MTDVTPPSPQEQGARDQLIEENRRLAQRCLELENAARRQLEKLRLANAVLARGEADLRVLLESAAIGYALVDLNLRIASANKALADLLGYAPEEMPGANFGNFVYVGKIPAFTRLANRSNPNAKTDEIIELVGRDGALIPCRIAVSDWLDEEGALQGHFLLILDAGPELTASERLRDMEQAMAEAERSRIVFLEVISRELRTPANSVMGMARMLMDAELSERQAELAGVIHSSANSLVRLVDDVADVVHMDPVESRPVPTPVSPADLAGGTVNLFMLRAEEKGLDLRIHLASGLPDRVLLDSRMLRRVLAHLLDNALKFTERGHIALSVDVVGESIRFMVSDTGPGFDAEAEESLFGGSGLSAAVSRRYGGIGVGLAICRRLTAAMGGKIAHESNPGYGSEFHITLPLVLPGPEDGTEVLEPPAEALHLAPLAILLADANPLSRRVITAYLHFDGHTLTLAESGVDAAEKCRTGKYDLLIIDLNLSKLDGLQTLKLIREEEKAGARKRVPVLLLGSGGQLREENFYSNSGADGILRKPIQPVALMAAIAQAAGVEPVSIARRRPTRAYSAHSGGSSIRRLDGRQLVNLRQVMPDEQFVGMLRFFMEDAVPGLITLGRMIERDDPDHQRIAFAAGKARGLASYLGFSALADVLKRIESAGRTRAEPGTLKKLSVELADVTDDSLEELKRIIPESFATMSDLGEPLSDADGD